MQRMSVILKGDGRRLVTSQFRRRRDVDAACLKHRYEARPRRMNAYWWQSHSLERGSPNSMQEGGVKQHAALRRGEHAVERGTGWLPLGEHSAQRLAHRYGSLTRCRLRRLDQLAGLLVLNTLDVDHASVETSLSAVYEIHADLILDATDEKYIRYVSRGRFKDGVTYHYQREAVQNLWKGKTVTIGRSTKPAFDLYEMSEREEATGGLALLPDNASGELLLVKSGRVLTDDYNGDMHSVLSVFNTWRGFNHKPIKHRDNARGEHVVTLLTKLLGCVTRDNEAQTRRCPAP